MGSLLLTRGPSGTVHARYDGDLGSLTSGASIGTIPSGYRPTAETTIVLTINRGDAANAFVIGRPDGTATFYLFPGSGVTLPTTTRLRGSTSWQAA